jgi:hypothetical protein
VDDSAAGQPEQENSVVKQERTRNITKTISVILILMGVVC